MLQLALTSAWYAFCGQADVTVDKMPTTYTAVPYGRICVLITGVDSSTTAVR